MSTGLISAGHVSDEQRRTSIAGGVARLVAIVGLYDVGWRQVLERW